MNTITNYLNNAIQDEDMMEYTEYEFENLLNDLISDLHIDVKILVYEISDGKYEIHISNDNVANSIKVYAWESKDNFINDICDLFNNIK